MCSPAPVDVESGFDCRCFVTHNPSMTTSEIVSEYPGGVVRHHPPGPDVERGKQKQLHSRHHGRQSGVGEGPGARDRGDREGAVHDWKRAEVDDGKNHWIVSEDAPGAAGSGTEAQPPALLTRIELEQAMAASRKRPRPRARLPTRAYDSSSSSSSSASGRRRRRRKKRRGERVEEAEERRQEEEIEKRKDRKKDERRRKRRRAERSSSSSDSETDKEARVPRYREETQAQTGGINRRWGEQAPPRSTYRLNATVDLRVMERCRLNEEVIVIPKLNRPPYTLAPLLSSVNSKPRPSRLRRRRRNPAAGRRRRSQRALAFSSPRRRRLFCPGRRTRRRVRRDPRSIRDPRAGGIRRRDRRRRAWRIDPRPPGRPDRRQAPARRA